MAGAVTLDAARLDAIEARERAAFTAGRPRSAALHARARRTMPRGVPMSWMDDLYDHDPVFVEGGAGARLTDVDGHTYLDLYLADMSAFCGHAPPAVVDAITARARAGTQFLLPGEDAVVVAEHLADRYGLPQWQFTLSATQANVEVVRLARAFTGRTTVLLFDGKYHGHLDTTLVVLENGEVIPEEDGLPPWVAGDARVVPFNDVAALERALAPRDVAVVLAEPAMSNAGFILPEPGFHEALRRLTRETEALLAIDETHTLVCAHGGLTGAFDLEPDMLVLGKSIAGGVPLGAYGLRGDIAALIHPPDDPRVVSGVPTGEVATGGTLFANALSMAAARAALLEVLTETAFARTAALGERLADGLRTAIGRSSLSWSVVQLGAHASYFFTSPPPRTAAASRDADDPRLRALMRLWLANRGVWESGWWLGPTVSVAHRAADVDRYVELFGSCLADLTG